MKLLAIDIGASSGRAISGDFSGPKLELSEVYRFPNSFINVAGHKHWKILQLLDDVKQCLRAGGSGITAVGIDTWGVDYGYINHEGDILGVPFSYRDLRTAGGVTDVHAKIHPPELFKITGLQFMPFNTIYQIADDLISRPWLVEKACKLLMTPELLACFITGEQISEYTICSTSGMLDAGKKTWSETILNSIGFPLDRLAEIVKPGEARVPLTAEVKMETGTKADLIYTAGHDTACAVAAVPAEGQDWAYISSGTWSLVGMELSEPILSDEALRNNFTNEGGVNDRIRFLKNVSGLWIIQELQRLWARHGNEMDFAAITMEAESAPASKIFIDPDHESFLAPEDMRKALSIYCRNTGQSMPEGVGPTARCVFESLALKYRYIIRFLGKITGQSISRIHIVGGGSQNALLCRMTAEACNLPVYAGPSESTAIGNLLAQAISCGLLKNIEEGRQLVKKSFMPIEYIPSNTEQWDEAAAKFENLINSTRVLE